MTTPPPSIVGVAERAPVRDTGAETDLTLSAAIAVEALADGGLGPDAVDGLLTHPMDTASRLVPSTIGEYLGLRLGYADSVDLGGATAVGMLWRAAAAIRAGMCSVVLCLTAVPRDPSGAAHGGPTRRTADLSPWREFEVPYGNIGATEGYALIAMRYEHEYGDTARARAAVAVAQRANAAHQPKAYFSGTPLDVDEVMASEMIADPLRKLDCVLPTGGAAAVVVVRGDLAERTPHPAVPILGAGEAVTHKTITYAPSLTDTAIRHSADRAFATAGIDRSAIGLASVYDCYTSTVLLTLEDAGFCAKGRAAEFVGTHDLTWRGDFPLNTHGGQLSFGQADVAGGMSHVTEAVLQLQGRGEGRQVRDLRHAFVHGNGGIMSEQASVVLGVVP
ncbi:thiolase family protein [Pseudonocardia petroleophila]|uniref:Thiolase family protein n=1 Tax=Pseudonocardia petroleophila TaxID=37331 RepID=A0A7G7MH38_9PSEU|nr:thiolase family protein [Pseudonocardia petroleophila]QNG52099.1 thiolase family protein [Pseudonocardia petroleophila]